MANLTETAYYSRKIINFAILGSILFIIGKILLEIFIIIWLQFHPAKLPPPNVAFNKLPAIKFPPPATSSASLSFALETIEGGPPQATEAAVVYFINKPAANLLSLNRAKQLATGMGFRGEPQAESQTLYRWQDTENPFRTLKIDIITYNFSIKYDYAQDLSVFDEKDLPSQEKAIIEARNFLENLTLNPAALENGETKVTFWQIVNTQLVQTSSLSNADAVRVDIGREAIDKTSLYPAQPPFEPVYFIFSGSSNSSKRILEASYNYWQIDTEHLGSYPLKSAVSAWEELKSGQGFVARVGNNKDRIVIRKIFLAYFYPADYQSFIQPIFVFEGDRNFLAFVPAVTAEWTGQ